MRGMLSLSPLEKIVETRFYILTFSELYGIINPYTCEFPCFWGSKHRVYFGKRIINWGVKIDIFQLDIYLCVPAYMPYSLWTCKTAERKKRGIDSAVAVLLRVGGACARRSAAYIGGGELLRRDRDRRR